MPEVTNSEDVFDSRTAEERITELEAERDQLKEAGPEDDLPEWEAEELRNLIEFREQTDQGYNGDTWRDGITFVRDSYFTDYAQELAEDIGAINRDATWPNTHIDWDAAADDLRQDYISAEFGGVTYWYR